jgi:hypothetical protein
VLVIETVSVVILPFNEVSEQFAFEEGEGNRSLSSWRMAHENYFRRNHFENRAFDLTMLVVLPNGSRLSTQSIDRPNRVKAAGGTAARTESRAKRVPTLVDRVFGTLPPRKNAEAIIRTLFKLCGKL